MSKKYAVIGLGSFGASAARSLSQMGVEVIAIDRDRERVESIKDDVTSALILDATDERALRAQDLYQCKAVILALGDNLGETVLVLSSLHSIGIKKILVQVEHHNERRIMQRLGASDVVVPSEDAGLRLAQKILMEGVREALPMGNGYWLATVKVPIEFVGKNLLELKLREKFRLNVVALFSNEREGDTERLLCRGEVDPRHPFEPEDYIGLFGREEDVHKLLDF